MGDERKIKIHVIKKNTPTAHNAKKSEAGNMTNKTTGDKAAKAASKVLKDGRTGKDSKTAAGSALSQVKKPGKKK